MAQFVNRHKHSRVSDSVYNHCIMGIFRNESHVLAEWIEHYIALGFEHFYLIDNNSSDDFEHVLQPYLESGIVELFTCYADGYQVGCYTELLPLLKEKTKWIGVFDLDEFIYPGEPTIISNITTRYSKYESILIPWLSFGSSGYVKQPPSVLSHFTRRGRANVSRAFLKAISKPKDIVYFSQHNPTTLRQRKVLSNGVEFGDDLYIRIDEPDLDNFLLINNHYRLQSFEYFQNIKCARPEVNEEVSHKHKEISYFNEYDKLWSEILDVGINEWRINIG